MKIMSVGTQNFRKCKFINYAKRRSSLHNSIYTKVIILHKKREMKRERKEEQVEAKVRGESPTKVARNIKIPR